MALPGAAVRLLLAASLVLGAGCGGAGRPARAEGYAESRALRLEELARGLDAPVYATAPPGDARLFIVEQEGRIRILRDGRLAEAPFLDIVSRVSSGGERGLLSCAFDPAYATNGFVYVNYTDKNG